MVNEWEQGLRIRAGLVVDNFVLERYLKPKEVDRIRTEEEETIQKIQAAEGKRAFWPFHRPSLPEGYKRSWVDGRLLHPNRFSKLLRPGLHVYVPVLEYLIIDSGQEYILNLKSIVVTTSDKDVSILISANIRYQLLDLYRAVTAVHDYEASLRDHALSILAQVSMGRPHEFWKMGRDQKDRPELKKLEDEVEDELRKLVTERWGIKIHQVYLTDVAPVTVYRQFHDGVNGENIVKLAGS